MLAKKENKRNLKNQHIHMIRQYKMPPMTRTVYEIHTWMRAKKTEMEQSVPKRRHIKFGRRGITQKKAYNIQNTAKVGN